MAFKTKKRKKSTRMHGSTRYGHGSRKKWKKSGHRGGCGMAGTGKRADQKTTWVTATYGNGYFGKQGITGKSTEKKRKFEMNLFQIECNLESLLKKFGKNKELILEKYKILGEGEIKTPVTVKAKAFSPNAKIKIEKAGGKAIILEKKETEEVKEKPQTKIAQKKKE
jgi:large subunit ribosomal protein L15